MLAKNSLKPGMADMYPRGHFEGQQIGLDILGEESATTLDGALSLTAHKVAAQMIVIYGASDIEAVVALSAADEIVREFFSNEGSI